MSASEDWRAPLQGLRIPRHIAVIMDGNGRWARQRGLPRIQGHFEGRKATKLFVQSCREIGVQAVSTYAFSTENWKRPPEEVQGLMMLIETALREETPELHDQNIRFMASGRIGQLPETLQQAVAEATELTRHNSGMVLNVLLNYSGRAEIVDAARALAQRVADGTLSPEGIDEAAIAQHLYAPELGDPDLLLRPGGEFRYSNFLLWEMAYTELVVMPVLWPDFGREHLVQAIAEFNRRQRRFGGVVDSPQPAQEAVSSRQRG